MGFERSLELKGFSNNFSQGIILRSLEVYSSSKD
jgi:hypothetical protein